MIQNRVQPIDLRTAGAVLAALAVLLFAPTPRAVAQGAAKPSLRTFAPSSFERFGIRRLKGKHITLYTDLPSDAEVGLGRDWETLQRSVTT